MRELPILFSTPMVRAILDGRKTVMRRVVKPAPYVQRVAGMYGGGMLCFPDRRRKGVGLIWPNAKADILAQAPYQLGDRLFVRESWQPGYDHDPDYEEPKVSVIYKADNAEASVAAPSSELAEEWDLRYSEDGDRPPRVRAPASMPKWASRIWLDVTDMRVERMQDGEGECDWESRYLAEGINRIHHGDGAHCYSAFRDEPHPNNWNDPFDAWRELCTSTGSDWDANPYVWVIEFKRVAT